jgi:hypothetical protein
MNIQPLNTKEASMADKEPTEQEQDEQLKEIEDLDVLPEDADKVKAGLRRASSDPCEGGE